MANVAKPASKSMVKPAAPLSKATAKPAVKPLPKPVIAVAKPKSKGDAAKPVSKSRKGASIAMFIDIDNTNASATNVLEIISILQSYGNFCYGKLYGYTPEKTDSFREIIDENKLETAGRLRFKTDGVSVVDIRLVLESVALTQKNRFDSVFVWAGVGELAPLFERLRELDSKTLTVDLPDFDCKNKFIDQAIKLFSPHGGVSLPRPIVQNIAPEVHVEPTSVNVTPPPLASQPATPTSKVPPVPIVPGINFDDAPQLPRKAGAPVFGATAEQAAASMAKAKDDEMDPEEYRNMLLGRAAATFKNIKTENQTKNEFGSVLAVDNSFDHKDSVRNIESSSPFEFDEVVPPVEPEPKKEPDVPIDDTPWLKTETSVTEPAPQPEPEHPAPDPVPVIVSEPDTMADATPWLKPETEEGKTVAPDVPEHVNKPEQEPGVTEKTEKKAEDIPTDAEAERMYNTPDESKKYGEDTKKHDYSEGNAVPSATYDEPEIPDGSFTDFGDFGSLMNVPTGDGH